MDKLNTKSLVLDTALNLSRMGKFALNQNISQAKIFHAELVSQLNELKERKPSKHISEYVNMAQHASLKIDFNNPDINLLDDIFTASTVLIHRANLISD